MFSRISLIRIWALLAWVLAAACSDDGALPGSADPTPVNNLPDISIFGTQYDGVHQIDILNNLSTVNDINLVNELGLDPHLLIRNEDLTIHENLATFKKYGNSYSIWQKDVATGETLVLDNFCDQIDGRFVHDIFTSQDEVLLISGDRFRGYFLSVYDKHNQSCKEVALGDNITPYLPIIIGGDRIAFYYLDLGTTTTAITLFDLKTLENLGSLDLGEFNFYISATLNQQELLVFFRDQNICNVYDLEDLSFSRSLDFDYPLHDERGLFEVEFHNNLVLSRIGHPVLSGIPDSPVLVDLNTNQIVKGGDEFMAVVSTQIQDLVPYVYFIRFPQVDLSRELLVFGFTDGILSDPKGGIAVANFDAEILGIVETDMEPQRIIIH